MQEAKEQPIDVAVGILMRPNGDVLLGQRPAGKPYAGYWEFPGGKVEAGEAIFSALQREFVEELGVQIDSATAWCCVEHVYEHAQFLDEFALQGGKNVFAPLDFTAREFPVARIGLALGALAKQHVAVRAHQDADRHIDRLGLRFLHG